MEVWKSASAKSHAYFCSNFVHLTSVIRGHAIVFCYGRWDPQKSNTPIVKDLRSYGYINEIGKFENYDNKFVSK
jgi:hypothetical protein